MATKLKTITCRKYSCQRDQHDIGYQKDVFRIEEQADDGKSTMGADKCTMRAAQLMTVWGSSKIVGI